MQHFVHVTVNALGLKPKWKTIIKSIRGAQCTTQQCVILLVTYTVYGTLYKGFMCDHLRACEIVNGKTHVRFISNCIRGMC